MTIRGLRSQLRYHRALKLYLLGFRPASYDPASTTDAGWVAQMSDSGAHSTASTDSSDSSEQLTLPERGLIFSSLIKNTDPTTW